MKIFTSWIRGVLIRLLIKHVLIGTLVFIVWRLMGFHIDIHQLIVILIGYALLLYAYVGLTNHDFIIHSDKIVIINRIYGFRKNLEIAQHDIERIYLKEDWMNDTLDRFRNNAVFGIVAYFLSAIVFPPEYKWVEIKTKNNLKERYYCFGLEYDCNGDNEYKPTIDDLYGYLKTIGLPVQWR